MKTIVLTAAALMLAPAVFAQTAGSDRPAETATKPPPTGVAGNGVTTEHDLLPGDEDGFGTIADSRRADECGRHERRRPSVTPRALRTYCRSITIAMPWPPPMHMVTRP